MSTRTITGGQIKAARGLLGWSRKVLAHRAAVDHLAIHRLERGRGAVRDRAATVARIADTMRRAGVEFMAVGQGNVDSVTLRKRRIGAGNSAGPGASPGRQSTQGSHAA